MMENAVVRTCLRKAGHSDNWEFLAYDKPSFHSLNKFFVAGCCIVVGHSELESLLRIFLRRTFLYVSSLEISRSHRPSKEFNAAVNLSLKSLTKHRVYNTVDKNSVQCINSSLTGSVQRVVLDGKTSDNR